MVAALAVAAALGGGLAGCHPTGEGFLDVVYPAGLAAFVTVAASRSSRTALLVVAAASFAMSRWWLWLPAGAALGVAFGSTFQRRSHRRLGALVGALVSQVMLRWPPVDFHGFTAAVAGAVTVVVAVSAWRHSRRATRRWALVVTGGLAGLVVAAAGVAAVAALAARGPAEAGMALARQSLRQVESGQSTTADGDVRAAAGDLGRAAGDVGGWWDAGAYLVPVVAQQERALARATRAGADLTATAAVVAPRLDYSNLRYSAGRLDVAALGGLEAPAADLQSAAAAAAQRLAGTSSPWLVAPIRSRLAQLAGEVGRVDSDAQTAVLAARDAPAILGADGVRYYLVAFMTPAETRGLGGFVGAYGVLRADDGHIRLIESGAVGSLRQVPGQTKLSGPASYLARFGAFDPQDHFQDLTYAPDLPTVEEVMAQVFPQLSGQRIDGVLVVDPYALAALLKFTGPIAVAGLPTPLDATNAAEVLLRQQYLVDDESNRLDELQGALVAGFDRLSSGDLPSPRTISAVLGPEVRQGRLLLWTSHSAEWPLLERIGLAGAFPRPGPSSDVLAITVANAANNKIDAYLTQNTSYAVDYDPATGRVASTVTVKLTNTAPASGMPSDVIGSRPGSGLPAGTDLTWLCLYTRLSLRGGVLDGHPTSLSGPVDELGVRTYCTFVDTPSEATSTLTVSLAGRITPGPAYRLAIRLQPLANPQTFTVDARVGTAAPTIWVAGSNETQSHWWWRQS